LENSALKNSRLPDAAFTLRDRNNVSHRAPARVKQVGSGRADGHNAPLKSLQTPNVHSSFEMPLGGCDGRWSKTRHEGGDHIDNPWAANPEQALRAQEKACTGPIYPAPHKGGFRGGENNQVILGRTEGGCLYRHASLARLSRVML
jgi:hypothetical protein